MRVRTPDSERQRTAGAGSTTASRLRGLARHLLTAIGLLTVTYAVLRLLGPRDDVPIQSVDEAKEEMEEVLPEGVTDRAADAVPDDSSVDTIRNRMQATDRDVTPTTIDGPRSEASAFDPGVTPSEEEQGNDDVTGFEGDSETESGGSETDSSGAAIDDGEATADSTDGDLSDAGIAERIEPDAGDEPVEPGEMAVDEGVAENLADEIDADEPEE
ncbi:hypothetical protein [Natrinema sp. CGMCC1.2065]|uniref:hypothetical protein n=1 Tax=Natrinema sp. CGMCC1.2065 TaxID=3445767 RepID=UPI003F4A7490